MGPATIPFFSLEMRALSTVLVASVVVGLAQAGIYPDDHWNYATQLNTDDEFDSLVKTSIDEGKPSKKKFETKTKEEKIVQKCMSPFRQ